MSVEYSLGYLIANYKVLQKLNNKYNHLLPILQTMPSATRPEVIAAFEEWKKNNVPVV